MSYSWLWWRLPSSAYTSSRWLVRFKWWITGCVKCVPATEETKRTQLPQLPTHSGKRVRDWARLLTLHVQISCSVLHNHFLPCLVQVTSRGRSEGSRAGRRELTNVAVHGLLGGISFCTWGFLWKLSRAQWAACAWSQKLTFGLDPVVPRPVTVAGFVTPLSLSWRFPKISPRTPAGRVTAGAGSCGCPLWACSQVRTEAGGGASVSYTCWPHSHRKHLWWITDF